MYVLMCVYLCVRYFCMCECDVFVFVIIFW